MGLSLSLLLSELLSSDSDDEGDGARFCSFRLCFLDFFGFLLTSFFNSLSLSELLSSDSDDEGDGAPFFPFHLCCLDLFELLLNLFII